MTDQCFKDLLKSIKQMLKMRKKRKLNLKKRNKKKGSKINE